MEKNLGPPIYSAIIKTRLNMLVSTGDIPWIVSFFTNVTDLFFTPLLKIILDHYSTYVCEDGIQLKDKVYLKMDLGCIVNSSFGRIGSVYTNPDIYVWQSAPWHSSYRDKAGIYNCCSQSKFYSNVDCRKKLGLNE